MRGASINLGGFAARTVLVFLHSFAAARLFGAEAYGVYAVGVAAVSLLSLVGQVGMGRTLTRFVALYQVQSKSRTILVTLRLVLGVALPVSLILGLVLTFKSQTMAAIFGEPALATSFGVLGVAVPTLTLAMLLSAFTQGFGRMRDTAIAMNILGPAAELLGIVALALLGAHQLGLSIAYTFSVVCSGALLIFFVIKDLRRLSEEAHKDADEGDNAVAGPVLRFAMPVLAVNTLMSASRRATIFMLGALGTSAMVGIYSILERLVAMGATFLVAANTMFGPMVTDLVRRQQIEDLSMLYKTLTRWVLAVAVPPLLLLAFFSSEILQAFGEEFVDGANALWYLVTAAILNLSTGSSGVILMMSGYPQYSAINEAVNLVIVIVLNWLLIPSYGLLGAVWAASAAMIIVNLMRVVQVWWHLRIQPYNRSTLKVAAACVMMAAVLWMWRANVLGGETSWPLIVLGVGIALAVYVAGLVALGLDPEEVRTLQSLQRRLTRAQTTAP